MVVRECKASEFADCDVVFSGLDADVAGDIGTYKIRPFSRFSSSSSSSSEKGSRPPSRG